jgi:hypothetical protein
LQQESNKRVKDIWERFLSYELGQLHYVMDLFRSVEGRDPLEVLPAVLPEPIKYESHREFVRSTLLGERDYRAMGTEIVTHDAPGSASLAYRERLNSRGSPSEAVASGYVWTPGTETTRLVPTNGNTLTQARAV